MVIPQNFSPFYYTYRGHNFGLYTQWQHTSAQNKTAQETDRDKQPKSVACNTFCKSEKVNINPERTIGEGEHPPHGCQERGKYSDYMS